MSRGRVGPGLGRTAKRAPVRWAQQQHWEGRRRPQAGTYVGAARPAAAAPNNARPAAVSSCPGACTGALRARASSSSWGAGRALREDRRGGVLRKGRRRRPWRLSQPPGPLEQVPPRLGRWGQRWLGGDARRAPSLEHMVGGLGSSMGSSAGGCPGCRAGQSSSCVSSRSGAAGRTEGGRRVKKRRWKLGPYG